MTRESPTVEGEGRGALLTVSGTRDDPGRCSVVKSNSAIDMHQRASLDCLGEMDVSHFKLAWFVTTLIFLLRTYGQNCSRPILLQITPCEWSANVTLLVKMTVKHI